MLTKLNMRDAATYGGVQSMTVSRVLVHPDLVADATRERVAKAIEDLGYAPDLTASSLSSRRSGFIATILPSLDNLNFAKKRLVA